MGVRGWPQWPLMLFWRAGAPWRPGTSEGSGRAQSPWTCVVVLRRLTVYILVGRQRRRQRRRPGRRSGGGRAAVGRRSKRLAAARRSVRAKRGGGVGVLLRGAEKPRPVSCRTSKIPNVRNIMFLTNFINSCEIAHKRNLQKDVPKKCASAPTPTWSE